MISVIIPSYNRANTLLRSAQSVLNQTIQDIELIIVDDGSTDNTEQVIENLKKNDARVRSICLEKNSGACVARNTGIDAARGEYIAFQDSDDVWMADKLDKQLRKIKSANADIVFCKYNRIKDGEKVSVGPEQYKEGFLNPVRDVYGIGTQTLLFKKEIFDEYRFDPQMPRFQELELLYRISKKYRIYCMDIPLVNYTIRGNSISSKPELAYKAIGLMLRKHPELLEECPDMGKKFATILIQGASQEKRGNKKKYWLLAERCDHSVKVELKIFLQKIGCYKAVRKVLKFLKENC